MNKKKANLYVKLTVKHPLPFIICIIIGLLSLIYITVSTKLNVINTYDGLINEHSIVINNSISSVPDKVYVYTNRNEAVYPLITTNNVSYNADSTTIYIEDNKNFINSNKVKVDITIGETTLFERVFLKGGKINLE
jgi:hypothetical protein